MSPTKVTADESAPIPRAAGPAAGLYEALHPETGLPVALKVYPRAPDHQTLAAFQREQATLAALRVGSAVLQAESTLAWPDDRWGLRMELCPQSLAGLAATGPLPLPDVLGYGEMIAVVLAGAHKAGLVHGGVTPHNVLFRASGQPLLSDFGLSLRQHFRRDQSVGIEYTAPEVLRGDEPDQRTDLYGLGCVLYLGLTGRSPHPPVLGQSSGEHILRVLREPAPFIPAAGQPDGLPALIALLLSKDPDQRSADAVEVAAAMARWLTPGARKTQPAAGVPLPTAEAELIVESGLAGPGEDGQLSDESGWDDFSPDGTESAVAAQQAGFDDFDEVLPGRRPSEVDTPHQAPPDRIRPVRGARPMVMTAVVVLSVLAVFVMLLRFTGGGSVGVADPGQPARTGFTPGSRSSSVPVPVPNQSSVPAVSLNLLEPVDARTHIKLTWQSSIPLDFAVIVAEQGAAEPTVQFVHRRTTFDVPVDPALKYCFQIQATDGQQLYESPPRPIRGAVCHL